MPDYNNMFAFEEHTKKLTNLGDELGKRYRALGAIYAQSKAALKKDLFFFAMCPEDGPIAKSEIFDAQMAEMEAAAEELAAKCRKLDHLWCVDYTCKSGEHQASELLIQGENELAKAQANIDDLKNINRKLATSLAESTTTKMTTSSFASHQTTPATHSPAVTTPCAVTGPLASQPKITTAVPFGDEVLQHEVSKVDLATVPWGKELLVSMDNLPLMGPNDAIVNRPQGLTPVSFGDDFLRSTMSQVTSSIKIPKRHDAEPVSASFTLPLLNPMTSTSLMLSAVDKASTGNAEVTSVVSMPKRNADGPMSTDRSKLPTLEKAPAGGSKDGAGFAPITPDVEAAASSSFARSAAAASPAVDSTHTHPSPPLPAVHSAHPVPSSPSCLSHDSAQDLSSCLLRHEPILCPEKWQATWDAYSPVPEIWAMGPESLRVTVRRGPGQTFQDTQAKKAAQRLLAQQAQQASRSFKRRMVGRLTDILGNIEKAKCLFIQLQREPEERVSGACQHHFGKVPGAILKMPGFMKTYIRERMENPESPRMIVTASRAR